MGSGAGSAHQTVPYLTHLFPFWSRENRGNLPARTAAQAANVSRASGGRAGAHFEGEFLMTDLKPPIIGFGSGDDGGGTVSDSLGCRTATAAAQRMAAGEEKAKALLRQAVLAGDHTPIAAAIVELAGQDSDIADGMAEVLARAALAGAAAVLTPPTTLAA